jgi:hypothetical protein
VTSSDAPPPPGGPLRDDRPDGSLQPSGSEHGAKPERDDDDASDGSVPAVTHEPEQSEPEAELQEENAETSLDQPSQ